MTKNIKEAIKIANKLKQEVIKFASSSRSFTHTKKYYYAKSFGKDWKFRHTFAKDLSGNLNRGDEVVICDQVVDFLENTYKIKLREFDSFTSPAYIKSFYTEKDTHTLDEKAKELLEKLNSI